MNDAYKSYLPTEVFKWLGGDQENIIDGSLEAGGLPEVMKKIGRLIGEISKQKEPIKEIKSGHFSSYDLFNFNGCRVVATSGGPDGFMFNKLDVEELLKYTK